MNIVKFRNINIEGHPEYDDTWYKEALRGKYAYWIRCRYIVPLDAMTTPTHMFSSSDYVGCELNINDLLGFDYYIKTVESGDYAYQLIYIDDITENEKEQAVLVQSVPSSPTADDPERIKTQHPLTRYLDLWDPIFWEGQENWLELNYIDGEETDNINSVEVLKEYNKHIPEDEIPLDDLKKFRTWLADNLIELGIGKDIWDDNEKHVLLYYSSRNNMADDTIKWLTEFGGPETDMAIPTIKSACGCGSGNISTLYGNSVTTCDPITIYRKNIKMSMIKLFSDIDTWTNDNIPSSFIDQIIKYLDGIIKANLPLVDSDTQSDFYSCKCLGDQNFAQVQAQALLRDTEEVFGWISTKDVTGHKNNIISVLSNWATNLYERMYW